MKVVNNNDLEYIISSFQSILDNYWGIDGKYGSWDINNLINSFNLDLNTNEWVNRVPSEYIKAFKDAPSLKIIKNKIQQFKEKWNIK